LTTTIYVLAERCIDCRACEVACGRVHGALSNVYVVLVEDRFAVPLLCRHCDPAPCAAACYTHALTHLDGELSLDIALCTGCGLCVSACPFGVMGWTADRRTVHFCDRCAERVATGQEPVCALTCPTEALTHEAHADYVGRLQQRAAAKLLRAERAHLAGRR
jgi:formate dehydrogenase iron-sulfur subunit